MSKLSRRGSPWPNIALGLLVVGALGIATAGPQETGPQDAPPVLAGAVSQPVVSAVNPSSGLAAGGTSVTIAGVGFTGATAVQFNGADAASFLVNSDTSITAVTPAGIAGPAAVTVAIGGCVSAAGGTFLYLPVPIIPLPGPTATSISPDTGSTAGGTAVTITGTNLSGVMGVTFGGNAATSVVAVSATTVTAVTPAHVAGNVPVSVATMLGSATVTGGYTYAAPTLTPTITSFTPTSGGTLGAEMVTVYGTNLTGATSVTFGGAPGTDVEVANDGMSLTVLTQPHAAGPVAITVTTPNGSATALGNYTFGSGLTAERHAKKAHKAPAMKKVFFQMPVPACPAPPEAPSPVTAIAGTSSINVTWTAAVPHDSPVTGYTVTATPGPSTCTTLVTDADPLGCVLGATAGQQYTVSVVAHSAAGDSAAATSAAVTPAAPVVPAAPPDTPLTLTTDKGQINTAAPGQQIVVIGTGFAAHSTATITLYSTPMTLGTVVTDGSGNFSKAVTVPASLAAGTHTLVAQGVAPSGNPRAMKLTVTVAHRAAPSGTLAVTGAPVVPLALAGLVMLLTGAVLVRPRRLRLR
ncbi:IPT/TIG domain-containing protein [Dactylosporangium sp. CS-033363]|uniref:IPT/TIG domain-containing protein n=1 Tax=Dactylosporangium sp. CS-033363 TaxID=3239935 RepID=UPI003D8BBE2E